MQEGPGNDDPRIAAVDALATLARSSDVRDRADAGHALAAFAEMTEAQAVLAVLLLDEDNTFVTLTTAEALLRRKDAAGLTAVAAAFATADDTQSEWLGTAVHDVYGVYADDRDTAVDLCTSLTNHQDPRIRSGATELMATLRSVTPILHPAKDAPPPAARS
ncbi:hypothetical protein [Nocardia vulneris]|uniref:HEAT repeat domain-containing protein n=1 Tax=Nocardia vulneris TaxID=1141657 RepID=A0ABR4ZGQ1_9NOCA|nr:hypothetical protein [Nocardia vulneris]KIA64596.1 hypothetical protein FG87_11965 [Nocardia vulneris]